MDEGGVERERKRRCEGLGGGEVEGEGGRSELQRHFLAEGKIVGATREQELDEQGSLQEMLGM